MTNYRLSEKSLNADIMLIEEKVNAAIKKTEPLGHHAMLFGYTELYALKDLIDTYKVMKADEKYKEGRKQGFTDGAQAAVKAVNDMLREFMKEGQKPNG